MQKNMTGDELLAGDADYVRGKCTEGQVLLAYPSALIPRFLVPADDASAQRFLLRLISADKGFIGMVARAALHVPGGLKLFSAVIFRDRITIKS